MKRQLIFKTSLEYFTFLKIFIRVEAFWFYYSCIKLRDNLLISQLLSNLAHAEMAMEFRSFTMYVLRIFPHSVLHFKGIAPFFGDSIKLLSLFVLVVGDLIFLKLVAK